MSTTPKFLRDETGSLVERVALLGALTALVCVIGADLLSSMLQKGELPAIAFVRPDKRHAGRQDVPGVGVDMSPTASFSAPGRGAAAVSPCETRHN
jgi:Flp pilus assembly pilin Flp